MKKDIQIIGHLIMQIIIPIFCNGIHAQEINLSGKWQFAMDKSDVGINEKWFSKKLEQSINLPGTMTTNNLGDDVDINTKWTASIYDSSFFFQPRFAKYRLKENLKIPFWLTPAKYYVGAAWYQKEIIIPENWSQKQIQFFIERTHIASQVWIDNVQLDSLQNSLVAPHIYHLPKLKAGRHRLTVRIDNRLFNAPVGQDAHSVSDHTQGNWNGLIGKIALIAKENIYTENVQIFPNIEDKKIKVTGVLNNSTEKDTVVSIKFKTAANANQVTVSEKTIHIAANEKIVWEHEITLEKKAVLWSEFNPILYQLQLSVGTITDSINFGMRQITVKAKSILVNNIPTFLRGNLNNCEFPLTGHPPMDVKSWLKVFTTLKSFGINHIRFHSWCPPDAAFTAADQLGMYLQPEAPTWPNHGISLGDGKFIDQYIYDETNRMMQFFGNHPSFVMLSAGNEPAGKNQANYLSHFIDYWKEKDNRRIYTGASVAMSWPLVPNNQYMVKSGARGLNFTNAAPSSTDDYNKNVEIYPVPFITHEQGQWCVFPDFSEIPKYTGAYKARNMELFKEDMQSQGLLPYANSFKMASGKLQALCYKMEIERSLRTNNLSGFQLLGLQDFTGQGTALVGVMNAFYQEKGYITAKEFNHFCNQTVPLLKTPKFTWSNNELFTAEALLFHFGAEELKHMQMEWVLLNDKNETLQTDTFEPKNINNGSVTNIGALKFNLRNFTSAQKLKLILKIKGTAIQNEWSFWVYPSELALPNNNEIYVTDSLNEKAENILKNGGKVLLQLFGKVKKGKEVIQAFTPVFWNTSWFKMRPPHTLGLYIDTTSASFKDFPTSYHSDLQWWEIVTQAQIMHLENFPKDLKPLILNIDTWFMNRRLAMLFEAKVGNGKIMVCSADLSNLDQRPVAKQLLYSITKYMHSTNFNPKTTVNLKDINELVTKPSNFVFDAFTKNSPDELKAIKN